jgi:hypothetical protein
MDVCPRVSKTQLSTKSWIPCSKKWEKIQDSKVRAVVLKIWHTHISWSRTYNRPLHGYFILLFLPPCSPHLTPLATGSLEPSLLVSPLLGGPARPRPFACRSSPAPTQIKPQPTPAVLGQESVHTTLSITHHSQERPSTGPRTLWSSNLFSYIYIWASLIMSI